MKHWPPDPTGWASSSGDRPREATRRPSRFSAVRPHSRKKPPQFPLSQESKRRSPTVTNALPFRWVFPNRAAFTALVGGLLRQFRRLAAQLGNLGHDVLQSFTLPDSRCILRRQVPFRSPDRRQLRSARQVNGAFSMDSSQQDPGEVEVRSVNEDNQRVVLDRFDRRQTGGVGGASRGARFHQEKEMALFSSAAFFLTSSRFSRSSNQMTKSGTISGSAAWSGAAPIREK